MTSQEFGRVFRKIVAEQNIPVRELERRSGVSRGSITRWLHMDASPRLEFAGYVLDVLGYKFEVVKK